MLNISYPRHLVEADLCECCDELYLYIGISERIVWHKNLRGSTYALLHQLHIFLTDAHPSRPPKMPPSLLLQILDHDAREHHHLRVNGVEDGVVREVETICDIGGYPCCHMSEVMVPIQTTKHHDGAIAISVMLTEVFVCFNQLDSTCTIVLVDLIKPCHAAFPIFFS